LIIGLILAMGGFGLTFYLGTQLASSTPTTPVLVAAHDIQAGTSISAGDLTTKKYLADSAPADVLHNTGDAVDHIARVDIAAGDPILGSMVGSVSQGIAPISILPVPPGYVAVQFGVQSPTGLLSVGEYVDIVADANLSLFKAGAAGNTSRIVFQSLEVVRTVSSSSQQTTEVAGFLLNECDLPYAAWLSANTTLVAVILPLHQGDVPAADTTCPGLVTDKGVGAAAVDSRYHFSS
jgi:Flp pilus assembly protein CpaB